MWTSIFRLSIFSKLLLFQSPASSVFRVGSEAVCYLCFEAICQTVFRFQASILCLMMSIPGDGISPTATNKLRLRSTQLRETLNSIRNLPIYTYRMRFVIHSFVFFAELLLILAYCYKLATSNRLKI